MGEARPPWQGHGYSHTTAHGLIPDPWPGLPRLEPGYICVHSHHANPRHGPAWVYMTPHTHAHPRQAHGQGKDHARAHTGTHTCACRHSTHSAGKNMHTHVFSRPGPVRTQTQKGKRPRGPWLKFPHPPGAGASGSRVREEAQ